MPTQARTGRMLSISPGKKGVSPENALTGIVPGSRGRKGGSDEYRRPGNHEEKRGKGSSYRARGRSEQKMGRTVFGYQMAFGGEGGSAE